MIFARRSAIAGLVVLMASSSPGLADDLTGTVKDAAGQPVPKVRVQMYTAGPKVGTATYCPSCYADCAKFAMTDESGTFRIIDLDPKLRFTVLASRNGYVPLKTSKVDPSSGPLDLKSSCGASSIRRSRFA